MAHIHPPQNILFSLPRTASHLLTRIINLPAQPSLARPQNGEDGYLFLPVCIQRFKNSFFGRDPSTWTEEEHHLFKHALQESFNEWTSLLQQARATAKLTYIKEHINFLVDPVSEARFFGYTASDRDRRFFEVEDSNAPSRIGKSEDNITCLPDHFLIHSVKPTFLIRHPCLTFPSNFRMALRNQSREDVLREGGAHRWECTYYWSLSLYRFYIRSEEFDRGSCVEDVKFPIVLDAADLADETLVRKYARAVGLDEGEIVFEWARQDVEGAATASILGSTGVEKGKLGVEVDFDLLEERAKWEVEFGDVLADRLFELVSLSMGDYEELRAFRLR
ncbi:unnamed protein product [Periconia digitata]|uniref:Uncharacterized protein n=1 Tax=Periconia digitata TaxID=1303443 RepID=A0A9W4UTT3_9PLEO|nr:unnamed protein product [Periconia digitata]